MAHENRFNPAREPDEAPHSDEPPPPPPKHWVRSRSLGWIEVEEENVAYWHDDYLWHDHPPQGRAAPW